MFSIVQWELCNKHKQISSFQVSDGLYQYLRNAGDGCALDEDNKDIIEGDCTKDVEFRFHSLQYSLFTNFGVEIIGGILFFITAIYIVRDKLACENASAGETFTIDIKISLLLKSGESCTSILRPVRWSA